MADNVDAAFSFILSWNLIGQRENRSHYVMENVSCLGFADIIFRWRQAMAENTSAFAGKVPSYKLKLTTSKHSIEFTYSDFSCNFKVNRDKLALINRQWKCKKGKRLVITANFEEQNLGAVCNLGSRWENPDRWSA